MSGLHEAQLIPGLVQDLQSLRLKLDNSVKRNEMLTEQYMGKVKKPTAEFACQTELSVSDLGCPKKKLRTFIRNYSAL